SADHMAGLVFEFTIHPEPAAFAIGRILLNTLLSKTNISIFLLLIASITPLCFLTSKGISEGEIGNITQYFDKIMAIVIGIFLHISTTILFESGSADHHKFNRKKMIAVILGVLVSLANFLFDSHDHAHHEPGHHHENHDHLHQHDHDHDNNLDEHGHEHTH